MHQELFSLFELPELKPELMLKFEPLKEIGKINNKINPNEALAKERNDIYNSFLTKDKPKYNNILFLYIDAIFLPEFIRAMKNTEKYLSKYFNSSEKSLYQMMKYIKRKGFITAHSNNICERQLYDIDCNYTENIEYDNFDHENIVMICGQNFYNPENRFASLHLNIFLNMEKNFGKHVQKSINF